MTFHQIKTNPPLWVSYIVVKAGALLTVMASRCGYEFFDTPLVLLDLCRLVTASTKRL